MITVKNLHKYFGGLHAVDDASIEIEKGSITGLIGPNGAGKTTLFNIIAGVYKPDGGQIFLDGQDITGLPPHHFLRTEPRIHQILTRLVARHHHQVFTNR